MPSLPEKAAEPSLKEWWLALKGEDKAESRATPMQSATVGLRANAEGALMGALLAFVDTDLGGLDFGGRIPLDWVGAAVFYALSIRDAGHPEGLSSDYRALGQSCTTVATYRMVHKWREATKAIPQNPIAGDPVLVAGKSSAF